MSNDPAVDIAVPLIAEFEGFSTAPYQDIADVWTIGYGFTALPDGRRVTADTAPINQDEGRYRLRALVANVVAQVRAMVEASITDNQAAALASLAYNIGTGALRNSTLLRNLNQGNYAVASGQFMAWTYAGGHTSPGLFKRRVEERALFDRMIQETSADDLNAAALKKVAT